MPDIRLKKARVGVNSGFVLCDVTGSYCVLVCLPPNTYMQDVVMQELAECYDSIQHHDGPGQFASLPGPPLLQQCGCNIHD